VRLAGGGTRRLFIGRDDPVEATRREALHHIGEYPTLEHRGARVDEALLPDQARGPRMDGVARLEPRSRSNANALTCEVCRQFVAAYASTKRPKTRLGYKPQLRGRDQTPGAGRPLAQE